MGLLLKLINLPWTYTRLDLSRFLTQTLNTRVKFTRILYDRQTGLSRGVALVQLVSDRMARDLIRSGTLDVDGRTVIVNKGNDETPRAALEQASQ